MLTIQKDTGIFLFTTPQIEHRTVEEYFGIVTGCSIQGVHFFKDALAYFSDKFGGRVHGYEASVNEAIAQSLKEMAIKAKKLGANAVIGVHMTTNDVGGRMLMAQSYGTAVKFR